MEGTEAAGLGPPGVRGPPRTTAPRGGDGGAGGAAARGVDARLAGVGEIGQVEREHRPGEAGAEAQRERAEQHGPEGAIHLREGYRTGASRPYHRGEEGRRPTCPARRLRGGVPGATSPSSPTPRPT